MDKLVYLAAQAARNTMRRQENISNNLANVSTPGFRSELMAFRSAPVLGGDGSSVAYSLESSVGFDSTSGQIQSTARDLDVAIQGDGWFAINTPDGGEAYTRAGSFNLNAQGTLVDSNGNPVVGSNGQINVPPDHKVSIEASGTITATPLQGQGGIVQLGQLKLVNPDVANMQRSDDGFFRLKDGQQAQADPTVRVASGFLEMSNVNAVEAMVSMIEAQRSFDMQMKMISSAQDNGQAANKLFGSN